MGLETVEIVLEVEERFGVKLADDKCSRVRTVAELAGLVLAELRPQPLSETKCMRAFFSLRDELVALGFDRRVIRPSASLQSLMPTKALRRRLWSLVRSRLPDLPSLVTPPRSDGLALTLTAIWSFALIFGVPLACVMLGWVLGVCVSLAGIGLVVAVLTQHERWMSTEFPAGVITIADAVRMSQPYPWQTLSGQAHPVAVTYDVVNQIRQITADQLGLDISKVLPESRFVDDLGC